MQRWMLSLGLPTPYDRGPEGVPPEPKFQPGFIWPDSILEAEWGSERRCEAVERKVTSTCPDRPDGVVTAEGGPRRQWRERNEGRTE